MKRFLLGITLLSAVALNDCAPLELTVYAQTLPAVVHGVWTPTVVDSGHPTPASQYTVVSDNDTAIIVDPAVACNATQCSVALTINSYGSHKFNVSAQASYISTDPASLQSSSVVTVNWVLSPSPNNPGNAKVTK